MTSEAVTGAVESPSADRGVSSGEQLAALGKNPGLTMITAAPLNVETPLHLLDTTLTPADRMFMRNNHAFPQRVDAASWSLTIDGLVRRPLEIRLDDLRAMPASSYVAVIECSGNGRQRFAELGTPAEGLQWSNGAVANVEWIGVPVALLLEQAGVKRGALQAECWSLGDEPFARGIEVEKLLDDAMLAYGMNGRPIPHVHGGPVRLVVPGWGGINWVKWVGRMTLISHESPSEYNQRSYVLYDAAGAAYGKVREIAVKSLITSVATGASLAAGEHELRGVAWSAARGVARVELSVDGGQSWAEAELLHDLGPRSWRAFVYRWQAAPGEHLLMARASDLDGNSQPIEPAFNLKGYLMNAAQRVAVRVRG
jgi:DMSO/TMAO reductase YedYZ molybdopterin-dependent catalytic subunit